MTKQEIKDGAPSGATGYIEYNGNIAYFKISRKSQAAWVNGAWNEDVKFLHYIKGFFRWYVFNVFNGEALRIKPL